MKPTKTIRVPTLAAACTTLALVISSASQAAEDATDADIAKAVENAMLFDAAVPSFKVDVAVNDGVATLDGWVNNLLAKERAVRAAENIRGVRAVVDKMEIRVSDLPDDELAANVQSALLSDPATDSYQITTTAKDGMVTLSGEVDSWQEKRIAVHVAKGVRGVKAIDDNILYISKSERTDDEIKTEIVRMQEIDALLNGRAIDVEVTDGKVKLSGTVGSLAERNRATTRAWVAGVTAVDPEGLEIEPWAGNEMRRKQSVVIKSDEQIKDAVRDAFLYDPRVNSFNPEIKVENGVVTLTGEVNNLKAKRAATHDASNTVGVTRVVNLLQVKPDQPANDDDLAKKVTDALRRNTITESYEITPTVAGGIVTLTGTVDSYLEKTEAEDVAQRTNGVVEVVNNLDVDYPSLTFYDYRFDPFWDYDPYYSSDSTLLTSRGDVAIKDSIEREFFWSPFVDGGDIQVSVKDGVATLTGTVDDWSEFSAATENAREGGAVRVENELKIVDPLVP